MTRTTRSILIAVAAVVVLFVLAIVAFRLLPGDFRGRRLLNALNGGHTTVARALIVLGTNPNFTTGHGTAMHYAAATGDVDLMRFLVKNGAAVDVPGVGGLTPYQVAQLKGYVRAQRYLLDQGAKPVVPKPIKPPQ